MTLEIAPSLLAADFYELRPQLEALREAGITILHVDVMDGCFVPNISIGIPVVESLKKCGLLLDVHLMIVSPERYIEQFVAAGAHDVTIHLESVPIAELPAILGNIRRLGAKAGVSIKPQTPVNALLPVLPLCDLVLLMTVEPGFGGQSYDKNGDRRIAQLRQLIDEHHPTCVLSVDGGINLETIHGAYHAGARRLVAGSAVFGSVNVKEAVAGLVKAAQDD